MCCDDVGGHIICRVLDRREPVDIHPLRENDDSAGMLAGRSADTDTALRKALELTVLLGDTLILKIMHRKAVGCLFGDRADRTCLEGLSLPEDDFRILLGNALLITGKIQVDIGLLIPLEPQERLERDVKSHLGERCPAVRTHHIRHIGPASSPVGLYELRIEVHIVAVRTQVVGRQRIHLRDIGHGRDQRRPDRSTGADEISVVSGFLHKTLGNDIHDRVPVIDDGCELLVQPLPDLLRNRVPVNAARRRVAHFH